MRAHATVIACLAAASTALGQTDPRIIIEVDEPVLGPGQRSTTIRLFAQFDDARDYAIAGIATSFATDRGSTGFSDLRLVAPMDGPGTSAGLPSAIGIENIIAGQLNFPLAMVYADPGNPIAFWECVFTTSMEPAPTEIELSTVTSRFDVYVDRGSARSESRLGDLVEGSATIIIIPAPATGLALLGVLALGRRRR